MSTSSNTSQPPTVSNEEFLDVVIIGAGISGINAAYRLKTELPNYSFTILEARSRLGGTWDLFRYPGIRSDSDLFTFGFPWNPWKKQSPIADGESIRKYLQKSAALHAIDDHIRFEHRLISAAWSSTSRTWILSTLSQGTTQSWTTKFLVFGTGYYDYEHPLQVEIPGMANYRGQSIHPQFWPEGLDYTDREVVIIGSGATAVTLLPAMTPKVRSITMLQRSPTYIVSLPNSTPRRSLLSNLLPEAWYHKLRRISWIIHSRLFLLFCRWYPNLSRKLIAKGVMQQLPATIPFDPHFVPRYAPWDQRLCLSPDGDFFKALKTGKATVETGVIREVVADGIELTNGKKLPADIIVTATGLKLRLGGGVRLEVDGKTIDISHKYIWNGVMLQDVPNAAFVMGYTDASWTLGAEAAAHFVCRILKHLGDRQLAAAVPRKPASVALVDAPVLNLDSTYVRVGAKDLPKAATTAPWMTRQTYFQDMFSAKYGRLDQNMEFLGIISPKI